MQTQPTRKGVYREEREFDTTQLHENNHGQMVHRDYAAHFFRWVTLKEAVRGHQDLVLDIGCGQDLPVVKVLHANSNNVPKHYYGVDLNKIKPCGIWWVTVLDEFNFIERWEELRDKGPFTKVCCFEVVEHMAPPNALKLLKAARELMADDADFFLSTPVFDGFAAVNHIFEHGIDDLHGMIELANLKVVNRWGTFGNVKQLEPALTEEERILWHRWKPRLGNEGLSVVFATDHPDQSRNNLWLLRR
jgi:hypothetical protein